MKEIIICTLESAVPIAFIRGGGQEDKLIGNFDQLDLNDVVLFASQLKALGSEIYKDIEINIEIYESLPKNFAHFGVSLVAKGDCSDKKLKVIKNTFVDCLVKTTKTGANMNRDWLSDIDDEFVEKLVLEHSNRFLEAHGGRKIKQAVNCVIGNNKMEIIGQLADKPPLPIRNSENIEMDCYIEGFSRPNALIEALKLNDQVIKISFTIKDFLSDICSSVCDDKLYRLSILKEFDAKGKETMTLKNIIEIQECPYALLV